jgi:hypothetical protein
MRLEKLHLDCASSAPYHHRSTRQCPLLHRKDYLQGSEILAIISPSRLVPIIATSPEPMATAQLGQMVTLSPRRLAEQPLRFQMYEFIYVCIWIHINYEFIYLWIHILNYEFIVDTMNSYLPRIEVWARSPGFRVSLRPKGYELWLGKTRRPLFLSHRVFRCNDWPWRSIQPWIMTPLLPRDYTWPYVKHFGDFFHACCLRAAGLPVPVSRLSS